MLSLQNIYYRLPLVSFFLYLEMLVLFLTKGIFTNLHFATFVDIFQQLGEPLVPVNLFSRKSVASGCYCYYHVYMHSKKCLEIKKLNKSFNFEDEQYLCVRRSN